MNLAWRHRWDVTPQQARRFQDQARRRVRLRDEGHARLPGRLVAVDVSYDRPLQLCAASLVEWDVRAGRSLREWTHAQPSDFPYVPGLLSFKEIPALLPLFERLPKPPPLVLCDGQGYAHPRRAGMASHLGVVLECRTMGWAKSRLTGDFAPPGATSGAASALTDGDEQIGWVLRSRAGCRPTFVSPGHRISMERALTWARALMGRYRLCDPARRAHALTRTAMADAKAETLPANGAP